MTERQRIAYEHPVATPAAEQAQIFWHFDRWKGMDVATLLNVTRRNEVTYWRAWAARVKLDPKRLRTKGQPLNFSSIAVLSRAERECLEELLHSMLAGVGGQNSTLAVAGPGLELMRPLNGRELVALGATWYEPEAPALVEQPAETKVERR